MVGTDHLRLLKHNGDCWHDCLTHHFFVFLSPFFTMKEVALQLAQCISVQGDKSKVDWTPQNERVSVVSPSLQTLFFFMVPLLGLFGFSVCMTFVVSSVFFNVTLVASIDTKVKFVREEVQHKFVGLCAVKWLRHQVILNFVITFVGAHNCKFNCDSMRHHARRKNHCECLILVCV